MGGEPRPATAALGEPRPATHIAPQAESLLDDGSRWGTEGVEATARERLRCATYNNLGCLYRRRNLSQEALHYFGKALALGKRHGGRAQELASTHLNVCAAYSSLKRFKEVRRARGPGAD